MIRRTVWLQVIILSFLSISLTYAGEVIGKVLGSDNSPKIGAVITLGVEQTLSNATGKFIFNDIPDGTYTLRVEWEEFSFEEVVTVEGEFTDLGEILVEAEGMNDSGAEIAVITLDIENIGDDTDDGGQEYSSILTASRDPYNNAAAYNFSAGRFYARGYNNEDRRTYLNGFPVNDLDDGRVTWSLWGGLNDVLRSQNNEFTLQPVSFAFGGVGGGTFIDLRASTQRPQTKIVYNHTNRSYSNRMMVTHSSGEQTNGWSYSLSGSRRWGNSGYIDGTFYDAWSLFGTVEKKINDKHSIGLTLLASPSKRGRFTGSVQEAYDLAGSNYYNANWGYQNGEVRNSRQYRTNQPIGILRHDWNINEKTTLTTTVGGQIGTFGSTRLDWYNASDPRPDYYRKLPSYYESLGQPEIAEQVREYLTTNPEALQLDWDQLYYVNQQRNVTIDNINGTDESMTGRLSAYVLEEQHFDTEKYSINSILETLVGDRTTINAGVSFMYENVHNYKILDDLLGGEFYLNLDNFALRDFPSNPELAQNDLLNPNRIVYEGDKFGWDYDVVSMRPGAWGQVQVNLKKLDLFTALELSNTSFYREGFYQNGRFPDSSLGKSEVQSFFNYGLKAGGTYKFNGRNYVYGIGTYRTRAPFSRNAFLSPRTRDQVIDNLQSETIAGGEFGYVFRFPNVKGRISAYYTKFMDQIESSSFYNDEQRTFVNFSLSGVDKVHQGIEFGMEANITSTLSFEAAAGISANQYTSRPTGTFTQDNSAEVLAEDKVIYIRNFYIPGPQQAYTVGLNYNSPKYWFATFNLNYFREIYLDINPDRRTEETLAYLVYPDQIETYNQVIDQVKMEPQFTLDFFGGKSWKFNDYYLYLNIGVNNILDNTEFATGGFEQGRFDYEGYDVDRFPPRIFYAYGRTYSLGLTLRF